ncbi:hypothetical protein Tco_0628364 [Tanacetum coccineum]|uniref:Uncharacterized protein n=1 Tax=Tanacetum coccineum TaxID=301880 RepID=A0ABQ4WQ56_9ASTR
MSTSTHLIIVLSDSYIEDAFSSTNTPDYTPASPDYFSTSPGNTFSDPSEDLSKDLLASLAISPFHDDPYMKVIYKEMCSPLLLGLPTKERLEAKKTKRGYRRTSVSGSVPLMEPAVLRVGAGGGEVKGGGVDFGVSRTLLGEIPGDIMGESGSETFGVDGGAD